MSAGMAVMATEACHVMSRIPNSSRFRIFHQVMAIEQDGVAKEGTWCCSFFAEQLLSWQTVIMPKWLWADGGATGQCAVFSCSTAPLMYLFHRGSHDAMGNLHYIVYDSRTSTWGKVTEVPKTGVAGLPALTAFKEKIFCFHNGLDRRLYWNTLDLKTKAWEGERVLGTTSLGVRKGPVALCASAFKGRILCFRQGCDVQEKFSYTKVLEGGGWMVATSKDADSSNMTTVAPELVAVEYGERLYCFHIGCCNDAGAMWYNAFDGESWSGEHQVPLPGGAKPKSMCIVEDLGLLYCFYRRLDAYNSIWYSVLDASSNGKLQSLGNKELPMPSPFPFIHADTKLVAVSFSF